MDENFDVVVVGGGAAGLSAAVALLRARRSTLVVDAGEPRNAPADGVHNFLTRDGTPPAELIAAGRAEVAGYGGVVVDGSVVAAVADGPGFVVRLADGTDVRTRRLVVTTGLVDELPDVPGLRERWGHDVLHCPYCHGWEVRDRLLAVLGTGPGSVHQALLWRQWSADVTLVRHTAPEPTDEQAAQLAARGVAVVDEEAVALEAGGLRLRGGGLVPCAAVVVMPRFVARSALLESLGVPTEEQVVGEQSAGRRVATTMMGATAVPGVWAAGNVTDLFGTVVAAAAAGTAAGAGVNGDLVVEEARLAVVGR